jgi:hypothetical protein
MGHPEVETVVHPGICDQQAIEATRQIMEMWHQEQAAAAAAAAALDSSEKNYLRKLKDEEVHRRHLDSVHRWQRLAQPLAQIGARLDREAHVTSTQLAKESAS